MTKRQGQRRGGLWDAAARRGPLQVLSWGLVVQIVRSRKSSWARCAPLGTGRRPPRRLLALTERAGAQLRAGFGETLGAHGSRRTGKAHAPRAPAPRMASLLSGGNVSAARRPLRGCTVTHLLSSQFRRRTRGHAGVRVAPWVVAGTRPGPKPQMPAHCSCPGCYAERT